MRTVVICTGIRNLVFLFPNAHDKKKKKTPKLRVLEWVFIVTKAKNDKQIIGMQKPRDRSSLILKTIYFKTFLSNGSWVDEC